MIELRNRRWRLEMIKLCKFYANLKDERSQKNRKRNQINIDVVDVHCAVNGNVAANRKRRDAPSSPLPLSAVSSDVVDVVG